MIETKQIYEGTEYQYSCFVVGTCQVDVAQVAQSRCKTRELGCCTFRNYGLVKTICHPE